MIFKRFALYRREGFMIKRVAGGAPESAVFEFSDLNPEQEFQQVITRFETFKIGLWFIRQSFIRWVK